jgi:hypothetical protein
MPAKMARSAPSVAVRGAQIAANRLRRQAVLSERGKSVKIQPGLGFIWRIPDKWIGLSIKTANLATIETDLATNQSLAEPILCLVNPTPGSQICCFDVFQRPRAGGIRSK